jgi:DHA1 family tetracycline resistance protein-like MFS transporter
MTQIFAYFTAPAAPVYFPGAAFIAAALLVLTGIVVLMSTEARRAPRTAPV